jgi:hypothetical protein
LFISPKNSKMLRRTNQKFATRTQATVAMGFVNGMLAGLVRQGLDPAPLLAAAAVDTADAASRVPVENYAALYNLINRQLDDEGFGLFAQPMRLGSFEFLCRSTSAPRRWPKPCNAPAASCVSCCPTWRSKSAAKKGLAELVISEKRPLAGRIDSPSRVFAFEWLLRLLHGLACWLAGRGLALDSVIFPIRNQRMSMTTR